VIDDRLADKITRAGVEAARRKFTPEFMNRIDRSVVFHLLGPVELRRILSIELNSVQQRILGGAFTQPFVFKLSESAKEFLLREGVDLKYGARHLKRSIERHVVYPLANLIATEQVSGGDLVLVDFDEQRDGLVFSKDTSWTPAAMVARLSASPPAIVDDQACGAAAGPSRWFQTRNVKQR
jgi:ATP-dependent Clp protease ATP-binding subunit ClpB